MKYRRSRTHESDGREQRRQAAGGREQQQPDERARHADDERVRRRAPIGVKADERLEQRRRELLRKGDHPDLREGQVK